MRAIGGTEGEVVPRKLREVRPIHLGRFEPYTTHLEGTGLFDGPRRYTFQEFPKRRGLVVSLTHVERGNLLQVRTAGGAWKTLPVDTQLAKDDAKAVGRFSFCLSENEAKALGIEASNTGPYEFRQIRPGAAQGSAPLTMYMETVSNVGGDLQDVVRDGRQEDALHPDATFFSREFLGELGVMPAEYKHMPDVAVERLKSGFQP